MQHPYLPTPNQGASRKCPAPFLSVPCLFFTLEKKKKKGKKHNPKQPTRRMS